MKTKINTNLKVTQKLGGNRPKLTNISMLPPFWATVYLSKKKFEHELSQGKQSELQTETIMNLMMEMYLGWF